jgi:hypothetical protein
METFEAARDFVEHASYGRDRDAALRALDPTDIDAPILDIVEAFAGLPHCFTLQCCYGHFVYEGQPDRHSLRALPEEDVGDVTYGLAYLALCIEASESGRRLRRALEDVTGIDLECVQFGSPTWFWEQYPNSYALQVEPDRFKHQDRATMPHREALRVQRVRDRFFARLRDVVAAERASVGLSE